MNPTRRRAAGLASDTTNQSGAGCAHVHTGGPAGVGSTPDATLTGEAAGDRFGESVASVGGVDGDGYADIIMAARRNRAGGSDAGSAYVREAPGGFYGNSVAWADDIACCVIRATYRTCGT